MTEAQAVELYTIIDEAIKQFGSAEAFLKVLRTSKDRKIVTHRKTKRVKKFIMRWLRICIRVEKGLPVYQKGGVLI